MKNESNNCSGRARSYKDLLLLKRRWFPLWKLDGYILREFLIKYSILLLVFIILFVLSDIYRDISDFFEAGASWRDILLYLLLRLPGNIRFILPISMLLGCMWTMAAFGKNMEVTAMRASGVSLFRCGFSIFFVGLLVSLVNVYFNEALIPWSSVAAERIYEQKAQGRRFTHSLLSYNSSDGQRRWLFQVFSGGTKYDNVTLKTVWNEQYIQKLIGNPGGCIISLSKKTLPPRIMKIQQPVKVSSAVSAQKSFNLPASGKFFAEWGKIKLGKYTLTLSAENDGAWQGKVFASLSDGTRTLKRECIPNSNVIFRFNSKTVVFRCRTAQSYMPVLVSGTFTEKDNKTVSGCRFDEDDGRIILQNSYLYAVILPQFGGRIGRLSVSSDSPNQLLLSEKTLSEGVGQSYRDFGGIEYNPGFYQGPGWQIPYSFKVLKKSKKEILIRLNRSGQYSLRRGGKISYEIFYRITADSPFLETEVRIFNDMDSSAKLSFRTHPEFIAGGDCSVQDIFCWKSPDGPASFSYRPGRNQYVPNSGNYFAWLDSVAGEGVLQTFTPAAIPRLYVWNGRTCYNSELHFVPVQTAPGKFASFKFDSAPIAGISRIDALADSFAAGFDFENKSVQILGLKSGKKNFVFSLLQYDKVLARAELKNVQLAPQKDFMLKLKKIVLPPGKYSLLLSDGKDSFIKSFTVKPQQSQDSSRELENLKQQYKTSPTPALRHRLFRFFSR